MKTTLTKIVTLGSLCALLAGTAAAASAQDNGRRDQNYDQGQYRQHPFDQHPFDQHRGGQYGDSQYRNSDQYRHSNLSERRRLDRLHAAYARAASHGNYGAAERDHAHAQAIRSHIRDQHGDRYRNGDHGHYQGDHGQYQGDQHQGDQHQGDHQGDHQDRHDNS